MPSAIKNLKSCKSRTRDWFVLIPILLFAVYAYHSVYFHDLLHFDDNEYFENYPEILNLSWASILKYFSRFYVLMYQPLPILSFALNYHFSGLDSGPLHLVNLFSHLANTALTLAFFRALSGNIFIASFVALVFAVHPMNAEAVSWISARSSTFYTFFYLSSLLAYLRHRRSKTRNFFPWLSAGLFVLSLFSKVQAVTLPLILLLIDSREDRDFRWRRAIEKWPFFLLSACFGVLALQNKETITNLHQGSAAFSFLDNFFLASYSFLFYLCKFFLPIHLSAVYVMPAKTDGFLPYDYYLSPALFAAVLFGIWKLGRRLPDVAWGCLFFFLTISINIQVIPSRLFIVCERYAYVPYLGVAFAVGSWIQNQFGERMKPSGWAAIMLALGTILSILTAERNHVWRNDLTLTTDIIQRNPESPYLARAFGIRADYAFRKLKDVSRARADFSKAIELDASDPVSYFKRGNLNFETKNYSEALSDFDQTIARDPGNPEVYNIRGNLKFQIQDLTGALQDYSQAIQRNPGNPFYYSNRGATRGSLGDLPKSIDDFTAALNLKPDYVDAFRNRGIAKLKMNDKTGACQDFRAATTLGDKSISGLMKTGCEN